MKSINFVLSRNDINIIYVVHGIESSFNNHGKKTGTTIAEPTFDETNYQHVYTYSKRDLYIYQIEIETWLKISKIEIVTSSWRRVLGVSTKSYVIYKCALNTWPVILHFW